MASYRYERDIQPGDLKPRREKQYTRKERWANWWDYNLKWVILIGIAVAFVAYNFIGQYFFTTKADYNVAVVAPYYLPEDTVNALQTQLAQFGEDRNGDGKVVVTLNVYTPVSYTHLRAHETDSYLVCRLLLEKKKNTVSDKVKRMPTHTETEKQYSRVSRTKE